METRNIIDIICKHFNVENTTIAKRKFGKLPEYTYQDILSRILLSDNTPIHEAFSEMSRPTAANMLKSAFPGKVNSCQNWYTYLLISVGLKRCTCCNVIMPKDNFSISNNKFDGIRNECRDCDSKRNKLHRAENSEHYKEYKHNHYIENTADYVRRSLARKAKLKHVTPVWANIGEMNTIYRNCPNGHHVDHIVPLQGAYVCGLNVEHNLQYLPAKDNLSKGNSFDSDKHIHTTEYVKPYL